METLFTGRSQEGDTNGSLATHEASTTSLPHGDIDIDPTGCSIWKDVSSPKVGLSKAEVNGLISLS